MKKKKKTKRSRNKKLKKRLEETSEEMQLRLLKSRGGRRTLVIKDKTKYDRKNKHKQREEYPESLKKSKINLDKAENI